MDRTPQHQTGRSRRLITGVALVAAATVGRDRDGVRLVCHAATCGRADVPQSERRRRDRRHGRRGRRQPVLPGARDERTELRDVSSARAGLEHHARGAARSLRPHRRPRPDLPHQRRLQLRRRRRLDRPEAAAGLQPAAGEGTDSRRARRPRRRGVRHRRAWTIPIAAARR